MALSIATQDLDNNPGISKTVYVDLLQVVPVGYKGDEQYMIKTYTSAYSNNELRTAIANIFVLEPVMGWTKSSGRSGTGGKFILDASTCNLGVKMDATVSGTDGLGYYAITLDHSNGTALTGEVVAADLEAKIRAVETVVADAGFQLAYTNATVKFEGGRFFIASGTIASDFTGINRSSVRVYPGLTNDCSAELGFDHQVTSEDLAAVSIPETLLAQDYTTNTATMYISPGTGAVTGDTFFISDGTNSEYFTPITISGGTTLTVAISGTNGFVGVKHSYATASGTYLQLVRKVDPDYRPTSYITDIDSIVRHSVKNMMGQIDYTS